MRVPMHDVKTLLLLQIVVVFQKKYMVFYYFDLFLLLFFFSFFFKRLYNDFIYVFFCQKNLDVLVIVTHIFILPVYRGSLLVRQYVFTNQRPEQCLNRPPSQCTNIRVYIF